MPALTCERACRYLEDVSNLGYRPELDGIRGIAILLVLLSHVFRWPIGGGKTGVGMFFVLSGFLITTLLLEEHEDRGTVSLRSFYLRRAFRLGPALLAFLMVYVLVALFIQPELRFDRLWAAAGALLYVADFNLWLGGFKTEIDPLWSLSIEEKFYMVWPAVLLLASRRSRLLPVCLIGIVVFAVLRHVTAMFGWGLWIYAPQAHFDQILIGAALAIFAKRGLPPATEPWAIGGLAGLALYLGVWLPALHESAVPGGLNHPVWYSTGLWVLGLSTAALIWAALSVRWLTRLLAFRPLVFVGLISYSLYLWHTVIWALVEATLPAKLSSQLLIIVGSFAAATLSYVFIERPALEFRRRYSKVRAAKVERELTALGSQHLHDSGAVVSADKDRCAGCRVGQPMPPLIGLGRPRGEPRDLHRPGNDQDGGGVKQREAHVRDVR